MIRFAFAAALATLLATPAVAPAAEKPKTAATPDEHKCAGCGARLLGEVASCPACGTEAGARPARPAEAVGLCTAEEKPLLSCAMKKGGKTLSICASKDFNLKEAVPTGTLAYRFGKPEKIELSWPEAAADARTAFVYKNETKPSGARIAAVSFEGKDGARYSAYVRTMGQRVVAAGQLVTAKGKKKAVDSECQTPGESTLGEAVDASFSREAFAESELDAVNALLKR